MQVQVGPGAVLGFVALASTMLGVAMLGIVGLNGFALWTAALTVAMLAIATLSTTAVPVLDMPWMDLRQSGPSAGRGSTGVVQVGQYHHGTVAIKVSASCRCTHYTSCTVEARVSLMWLVYNLQVLHPPQVIKIKDKAMLDKTLVGPRRV